MSDRRYEVYEVCKHGSVAPHEGWPLHAQVWGDYVTCDGGTRLDFVPDALVEEAAKRLVDEGGRLVVETPCEHGVFHDPCYQLVCDHDHGWYLDTRSECWCPGGSRKVVWPREER